MVGSLTHVFWDYAPELKLAMVAGWVMITTLIKTSLLVAKLRLTLSRVLMAGPMLTTL